MWYNYLAGWMLARAQLARFLQGARVVPFNIMREGARMRMIIIRIACPKKNGSQLRTVLIPGLYRVNVDAQRACAGEYFRTATVHLSEFSRRKCRALQCLIDAVNFALHRMPLLLFDVHGLLQSVAISAAMSSPTSNNAAVRLPLIVAKKTPNNAAIVTAMYVVLFITIHPVIGNLGV